MQEDLVLMMDKEKILDLILALSGSSAEPEFKPWNTILLEIVTHIFDKRQMNDILEAVD
jgi:hypothetical protein